MSGNGSFGVVSVFSASDQWFDDSASGSAEAGFHVSLTVGPGARLSHDRAFGNRYGILIASATGGTITGNRLTGNCSGIALSGEGLSGAASTSAWRVTGNLSASNDLACPPAGAEPGVSGNGITLWGVRDIVVAGNTVLDNRPSEPSVIAGGIVVKTSPAGDAPADIKVVGNILAGNKPADLVWDGSGSDVSFETNVCVTSTPPGFCR
jgi:parallel beta-helix repeat protein